MFLLTNNYDFFTILKLRMKIVFFAFSSLLKIICTFAKKKSDIQKNVSKNYYLYCFYFRMGLF